MSSSEKKYLETIKNPYRYEESEEDAHKEVIESIYDEIDQMKKEYLATGRLRNLEIKRMIKRRFIR